MKDNNIKFKFYETYDSDKLLKPHESYLMWVFEISDNSGLLSRYHLIYHKIKKKIEGHIESEKSDSKYASKLIDFTAKKLEEIVKDKEEYKDIDEITHVVKVTKELKKLVNAYERNGYKEIEKNILAKVY